MSDSICVGTTIVSLRVGGMHIVQPQCSPVGVQAVRVVCVCVYVKEGRAKTLARILCTIRPWIWRLNGTR